MYRGKLIILIFEAQTIIIKSTILKLIACRIPGAKKVLYNLRVKFRKLLCFNRSLNLSNKPTHWPSFQQLEMFEIFEFRFGTVCLTFISV